MRRAVLMMRQAISPRLAIRIRLNMSAYESRKPASRPLRRLCKMSMRRPTHVPTVSVDVNVGLLDDDAIRGKLALDPGAELRRRRGNGRYATGGEFRSHVGHVEDLAHFGIELVDDRLRHCLRRKKRGPVRRVNVAGTLLLERRPFRIERRARD